jgi:hypothetical protein
MSNASIPFGQGSLAQCFPKSLWSAPSREAHEPQEHYRAKCISAVQTEAPTRIRA